MSFRLVAGPDKEELKQIVEDMKKAKLDVTEEGDTSDVTWANVTEPTISSSLHNQDPSTPSWMSSDYSQSNAAPQSP